MSIDLHQNKKDVFKDMVDKVQNKLHSWKANMLSQAGRLTLAKSVLQSLPIYQFSTIHFPKKYTDQIDALTTNFFWGFKNDWPSIHMLKKINSYASSAFGRYRSSLCKFIKSSTSGETSLEILCLTIFCVYLNGSLQNIIIMIWNPLLK